MSASKFRSGRIRSLVSALVPALTLVLLGGCQPAGEVAEEEAPSGEAQESPASASAAIHPTEGNTVTGTVRFTATETGVRVVADLQGLDPNTTHGFHVHEHGDCSAPDATSAGGHFNPGGHPHALPGETPRHAGDLGNIVAGADGSAHLELEVDLLSIEGENGVVGRSVIVHAQPDDGGQPTGNAGARIGCGEIQHSGV